MAIVALGSTAASVLSSPGLTVSIPAIITTIFSSAAVQTGLGLALLSFIDNAQGKNDECFSPNPIAYDSITSATVKKGNVKKQNEDLPLFSCKDTDTTPHTPGSITKYFQKDPQNPYEHLVAQLKESEEVFFRNGPQIIIPGKALGRINTSTLPLDLQNIFRYISEKSPPKKGEVFMVYINTFSKTDDNPLTGIFHSHKGKITVGIQEMWTDSTQKASDSTTLVVTGGTLKKDSFPGINTSPLETHYKKTKRTQLTPINHFGPCIFDNSSPHSSPKDGGKRTVITLLPENKKHIQKFFAMLNLNKPYNEQPPSKAIRKEIVKLQKKAARGQNPFTDLL
ncbi:hypothetical protein DID78_01800 [Candidatus Marinamargulisbacteria bacterium SCGC AG-343-D04]|nr:hypothetical protein DID78_01800 [Candidatus Marinamargulisbacteria bacterium SCGC AG-343-D04]